MSVGRVLTEAGPVQVTVDAEKWEPDGDDEIGAEMAADEVRCHSLDESSSTHRASWPVFFGVLPKDHPIGRRSHPSHALYRQMSPGRLNVAADVTRRHRSSSGGRRYSGASRKERSVSDGNVAQGVTSRLLRLSRDATQPTSGSMSDFRGELQADNEESDVLPALSLTPTRPRSFTCPDIKVIQRKTKLKLLHRPPTPTPGDELIGDGLAFQLESRCSLSGSGNIFAYDEEDELPVIAET